jgi:hypothetical protein
VSDNHEETTMKVLNICTGWVTQQQHIPDHAKADAALKTIQDAMQNNDRFANDKSQTVTIDVGDGVATFRVDNIVSVTLDDCDLMEATIIEREVWKKTIQAKIASRLAPAA